MLTESFKARTMRSVTESLFDKLLRIDGLRGTGRLYLP
jgi:hypothetical protein